MEAKILKKIPAKGIPSASGIEIINDKFYVIGDDTPFMFVLDKQLKLINKILLSNQYKYNKGRIPKKEKPDLEALTSFEIGGETVIMVLGSGSIREIRDKAFLIEPADGFTVKEFSLVRLYDILRNNKKIVGDRTINIEAAAVIDHDLFLFQRGNISGKNVLIQFPLYDLFDFLQDSSKPAPDFKTYSFEFSKYHNLTPGFSGAACIPGTKKLLFTASLEDTPNEWYDGTIFESLIGIIYEDRKSFDSAILMEGNMPYKGKVESITVVNSDENDKLSAMAVTDNDRGASELLFMEILL